MGASTAVRDICLEFGLDQYDYCKGLEASPRKLYKKLKEKEELISK